MTAFTQSDMSYDATTILQEEVSAIASATGGTLDLPRGTYTLSDTITIGAAGVTTKDVHIVGGGKWHTVLQPTAAFGSKPVFKFINARDCSIEDLNIGGNATAPQAAIEVNVNNPDSTSPSRMRLRNLRLGGTTAATLAKGVRFTAATNYDQNNDFALFQNVDVINFTSAAYSFEHSNSLMHRIYGGHIASGPTAVANAGGSFSMFGTTMVNLTSVEFDFQAAAGDTPAYRHASQVIGVMSEVNNGATCAILNTTTDAIISVSFIGYERKGSASPTTLINFQGAGGYLTMTGCTVNAGQTLQTATFTSATSQVRLIANTLQFSTISFNGGLNLVGNHHLPGTVTLTNLGTGLLTMVGEQGGALVAGAQQPIPIKAGIPTDSDVSNPVNGVQVLDSTNHRLYVRDGSVWKYAGLT